MILVLLRQIVVMAALISVGYYFSLKKLLSRETVRDLGNILISVIIPCVVIKSCITDFSMEKLSALGISALLSLAGYILSMAIAFLIYGRRKPLNNFAAAFCNAGFIGIPLVQAAIGEEGVFYIAASIAFLNLFQWTYGVYIMTGDRKSIAPVTILRNPVLISMVIGVILFASRLSVPEIVTDILGYITGMNTPVAMFLLGSYLAKIPLQKILRTPQAYSCVLVRLIIIPAIFLGVLWLLPVGSANLKTAVFLAAATPVGANICIFADKYGCDYEFSVITVCLSTILSVLTIPVFGWLAQFIF